MSSNVFRRLLIVLTAVSIPVGSLSAQFVERAPKKKSREGGLAGDTKDTLAAELLQQAAIDYSSTGAIARIKVARVWLELAKNITVPVLVTANPTLLLPEDKESAVFSSKELLNQLGGLVNVASVNSWKLPNAILGQQGLQGDWRIGAKLVNFSPASGGTKGTTAVGHAGFSASYLMRAFGERPAADEPPEEISQLGLVTLNLRGGLSHLGGKSYRDAFRRAGESEPPQLFATFQADISIHFFDQFFMSAGYMGSTNTRLAKQGFVGFTVSKSNN